MALSIVDLANRLGASIGATPRDLVVAALATPAAATQQDLSFALRTDDVPATSQAAAFIMANPHKVADLAANPALLIVPDVLLACARSVTWLPVRRNHSHELDAYRAHSASSAEISRSAEVAEGAVIGHCTTVGARAVIGPDVRIGDFCRISAGAVILGTTMVGNRVEVGAGVIIGEDGFAFVRDGQSWVRMPSFGGVKIGDDVVILAGTIIHAGVLGDTIIESGCILDSQVLIGHDSKVGLGSAIAGQTALAGASEIGRGCIIGGQVGISEGVRLADRVKVTGKSMVTRSLNTPGAGFSSGWPAEPSRSWWRRVARLKRVVDKAKPENDEQ